MRIVLLANFPEYVEEVAQMINNEFVLNSTSKKTIDDVRAFFSSTYEKRLPLTLIALEGDECIGTVSIFENDLKDRKKYKPWLASLYIKPIHRDKGVGHQLLTETIKVAKELDFPELYLKTADASSYYSNRGWTYVESMVDETKEKIDIFVMKELK